MNLTSNARKPGAGRLPGRCALWLKCLALFALGLSAALAAKRDLGFSRSVTPGLMRHFSDLFGQGSSARLGNWQAFVRSVPPEPGAGNERGRVRLVAAFAPEQGPRFGDDLELLRSVNVFFNGVPFVSDQAHWGAEDYWASPAEMLASAGGDCEDYAIAKYFTLKELGVPIERLRITYVKAARLNQAHMVLAYYPEPGAEPLILDNLEDRVRQASERPDLVPVYSFNDEDLLLVGPDSRTSRAGSPLQIRLWRSLLDKLAKELAY
jgi:predicted transglutaminase-like cysteine proteinase